MKYPMYAIRDIKSVFHAPSLDTNDATAIRGFGYALVQPNSLPGYAPMDYQLFHVGDYDLETGVISPVIPIRFVSDGVNALRLYRKDVTPDASVPET